MIEPDAVVPTNMLCKRLEAGTAAILSRYRGLFVEWNFAGANPEVLTLRIDRRGGHPLVRVTIFPRPDHNGCRFGFVGVGLGSIYRRTVDDVLADIQTTLSRN